jgi:hypothetical protein
MRMRWSVVVSVAAVLMLDALHAGAQIAKAASSAAAQDSGGPVVSQPGVAPEPATPAAQQGSAGPQAQSVTVPAGTAIPLTLVSPIRSRSTKRGDTVRAMVAFPVTTGTQLAIPAGTYVEGTVRSLDPHTLQNKLPDVEIHFTRMLFANGYAVDLDADSTQARLQEPDKRAPALESARSDGHPEARPAGSNSFLGQQPAQPTLPPLPKQPDLAKIAGITMGTMAAAGIGMLVWMHHRATHMDYVLFDSGWQFQMVLAGPLTLDAGQVSAAASTPRAQ